MSRPTADPYAILGVSRDATREEAVRAYRRLAKLHHPDRQIDSQSGEQMQRINEAWEMLSSPLRRARYDADATRGASPAGGSGSSARPAAAQPASTTWAGAWAPTPAATRRSTDPSSGRNDDALLPIWAGAVMVIFFGLLLFVTLTAGILPSVFVGIALMAIARGVIGAFDARAG